LSEPRKFRAALVQLRTGRDVIHNIDAAAKLVREAKALGADYVQTPEQTSLMELDRKSLFGHIFEEEHDPALASFRELARDLKIHLHIGSLAVKVSPDKAANRTFFIDPNGEIVARYDKIHMFDVNLPNGESYRESNTYRPGDMAVVVAPPFCKIGLTICYDVRFPALYRALAEAGAEVITVPAAFTKQTGEAHWHLLLRARAVETGCFVLAADIMRTAATPSATASRSTRGAGLSPRQGSSRASRSPRSTFPSSLRRAARSLRSSTGVASRSSARQGTAPGCMS
jgi:predicted amidohydrolase